jgi:hypothetical protein
MALLPGQPDALVQVRPTQLANLLATYKRLGVTGAPGTGKSYLADNAVTDRPVIHCDAVLPLPWDEIPQAVITLCKAYGGQPLVVEGCEVPMAVRAGLALDAILVLETPVEEQSDKHITL